MRWIFLLAGLLASPVAVFADDDVDYRLPSGITPTSQAIELVLDPSKPDYTGTTTINLTIEQPTDRIALHQLNLDLSRITLASGDDSRTLQSSISEWDINWLTDGEKILPGDYELLIEFSGRYSTDSLGMHRVTYEGNDYVFTQMEAMYARRAFPIFDEPSFKIPYQLTIVAPEDLVAVANEPVASSTVDDGWRRTEFMPTPPLPSYLIAYAVGPLERTPIEGLDMTAFVYTPAGHADEVGFVTRETPTIVEALEEGDLSLDDSLKKFEEGVKLAKRCEKALATAEKKIEILTKNAEGDYEAEPFDEEAGAAKKAPRKKAPDPEPEEEDELF